MKREPRLYLAGPDVFLPHAVTIGRQKKALCKRYGFVGLFPFDNEAAPGGGEALDRQIYRANRRMIGQADAGIFNLTPFRGPSADVGTVFELGMMAGLGKPVFGYTSVASDLRARVGAARRNENGQWIDADGFSVEDFGNADNLMIDASLAEDGNFLLRVDGGGALDDMAAFERCVAVAASRMGLEPAGAAHALDQRAGLQTTVG